MPLVIEDGTIVPNANSYITVAEARAYANARGFVLPTTDAAVEVLIISAMDFVESNGNKFKGLKVQADQPLQWPRKHVVVDNFPVPQDTIPKQLKDAVCRLAYDASQTALMPNRTQADVKRNKVGPIEVEYQDKSANFAANPLFAAAQSLLTPLLKTGGMMGVFGNLPVVRA